MSVTIDITVSGPLFSKASQTAVKEAFLHEIMNKAEDKIMRPSAKVQKRIGFRRNKLTPKRDPLMLEVRSTVAGPQTWKKPRKGPRRPRGSGTPRPRWQERVPEYNPRVKGDSWEGVNVKNINAIVKRGGPTMLRRIVAELS